MVESSRRAAAAAFAGSIHVSGSYDVVTGRHTKIVAKVEEYYQGNSVQFLV
jgi:hypothetical protein